MKKVYTLTIKEAEGKALHEENLYLTDEQFEDFCRVLERAKTVVTIEDSRNENGINSEL